MKNIEEGDIFIYERGKYKGKCKVVGFQQGNYAMVELIEGNIEYLGRKHSVGEKFTMADGLVEGLTKEYKEKK